MKRSASANAAGEARCRESAATLRSAVSSSLEGVASSKAAICVTEKSSALSRRSADRTSRGSMAPSLAPAKAMAMFVDRLAAMTTTFARLSSGFATALAARLDRRRVKSGSDAADDSGDVAPFDCAAADDAFVFCTNNSSNSCLATSMPFSDRTSAQMDPSATVAWNSSGSVFTVARRRGVGTAAGSAAANGAVASTRKGSLPSRTIFAATAGGGVPTLSILKYGA
ncbi:hypothetical protein M885DRAFT_216694 [Pelagophyceae sp. CCMP2097]|nr:hypothetical protein M885DRAFT_216694 [Pelagophyceae sp. CCMP2097]|mmetsp:Transcript_12417/g.41360  ORF Transcript_12417/g.41360 Transcript_12417/m.41360 type:complete len:226 (+) Transcript_12417:610-1287(+)